jgi:hypothetical protein
MQRLGEVVGIRLEVLRNLGARLKFIGIRIFGCMGRAVGKVGEFDFPK